MKIIAIGMFKHFAKLSVDGFTGQVLLLELLGNIPQRGQIIEGIRRRATHTLKLTLEAEEEFTNTIRDYSDDYISHTARIRDNYLLISQRTQDPDDIAIAKELSNAHDATVRSLGEEETCTVTEIGKDLTEIRESLQELLKLLDNLRIR